MKEMWDAGCTEEEAPSDEGAVSEADWGRENLEPLVFLEK